MRRLVICFDGTWNKPDQKTGHPTNVVRFARSIRPLADDGTTQIAFYDAGVGTGNFIDRLQGGIFGHGLDTNVQDGYRFLAHNFQFGDEIYIFGFSRGAFTARSLAGFIGRYGLVHKNALELLGTAWRCYRTPEEKRGLPEFLREEAKVKENADGRLPIEVVGVWDTVGALGVPGDVFKFLTAAKYQFHDTQLSDQVHFAFHAMAIDEKRGPFSPTLWEQKIGKPRDRVEQVWFCGVHSNVGGSYCDERLANLALRWMVDRVEANTGLEFDRDYLDRRAPLVETGAGASHLGTIYESRTALYLYSKLWPRWRNVRSRFTAREKVRTHVPSDGCEYINEMLHWSVVKRLNSGETAYRPTNIPERIANLPVVRPADQSQPIVCP